MALTAAMLHKSLQQLMPRRDGAAGSQSSQMAKDYSLVAAAASLAW